MGSKKRQRDDGNTLSTKKFKPNKTNQNNLTKPGSSTSSIITNEKNARFNSKKSSPKKYNSKVNAKSDDRFTKKKSKKVETSESDVNSDESEDLEPKPVYIDKARGIGNSESSSEEESDSDDEDIDGVDHQWGELDADVLREDKISKRLAFCNLDWTQFTAQDIFVIIKSFLQDASSLKSVKIYQTEFGKLKLDEESKGLPAELKNNETEEETQEAIRKYEINKLRYYYAIAEFDSEEAANTIYEELDGKEFESSCIPLDIRVVGDDITFDEEPTSEVSFVPVDYKPKFFTNKALQNSKVEDTWDQTDPRRVDFIQNIFKDVDSIEEANLRLYLASGSEEESDNDDREARIKNYKALLADDDDNKEDKSQEEAEEEQPTKIEKEETAFDAEELAEFEKLHQMDSEDDDIPTQVETVTKTKNKKKKKIIKKKIKKTKLADTMCDLDDAKRFDMRTNKDYLDYGEENDGL